LLQKKTNLDLEKPDFAQRQKSAVIAGGQQQLILEDEIPMYVYVYINAV
jgi:hypothetical protein